MGPLGASNLPGQLGKLDISWYNTNTGPTVLHRLVRDRELAEVVADHLGLNLNGVEGLAIVYSNYGVSHLGDDDHTTEVGLDGNGLLVLWALGFRLAKTLHKSAGLAGDAVAGLLTAHAGVEHGSELLIGHVQESIEFNTSELKLAERPLLGSSVVGHCGRAPC